MTRAPLESMPGQPFPILIVQDDHPRVLMVEDLQNVPALAAGATYLVPEGREAAFQQELYSTMPHDRDVAWIVQVDRRAPNRQRIQLYLMGDGFWGGAYDATAETVSPLDRKVTGPGFAFIAAIVALMINGALWGIVAVGTCALRRRWARSRGVS